MDSTDFGLGAQDKSLSVHCHHRGLAAANREAKRYRFNRTGIHGGARVGDCGEFVSIYDHRGAVY